MTQDFFDEILGLDKKKDSQVHPDESDDNPKISYVPSAMERDQSKEPAQPRPRSRRENQFGNSLVSPQEPTFNNIMMSEYPPMAPTTAENRPPSRRNAQSIQPRRYLSLTQTRHVNAPNL